MNNFNLKYLIIAVIIISALMVGGALIFSKLGFKAQKLPTQSVSPNTNTTKPAIKPVTTEKGGAGVQPEKAIPLP